jgi:hypothetical protein
MNFSGASQLRIPVDVGRDYAMWATITVKQKCGPHHTGISGALHRNTHHPRISRGIWEDMAKLNGHPFSPPDLWIARCSATL